MYLLVVYRFFVWKQEIVNISFGGNEYWGKKDWYTLVEVRYAYSVFVLVNRH